MGNSGQSFIRFFLFYFKIWGIIVVVFGEKSVRLSGLVWSGAYVYVHVRVHVYVSGRVGVTFEAVGLATAQTTQLSGSWSIALLSVALYCTVLS